jgi:DNA repair protein RadC
MIRSPLRHRLKTVHITLVHEPAGTAGSPAQAEAFLRPLFNGLDQDRENFVILALDAQNNIRGFKIVATGGQVSTVVDPRTMFRDALLLGAAAIILAHNHPSGEPEPSKDDLALTRQLSLGGQILGIKIHDHIILGDGRLVSLAERGQME